MVPMPERRTRLGVWLLRAALVVIGFLLASAVIWRDDIIRTALDPKEPFQTYDPPPAPDYQLRSAWALRPTDGDSAGASEPAADVFFVAPTTYDGGRHWNAPIDEPKSDREFRRTMAPNYAGPFVRVGRIFAPRYRQASLYSMLTLREDAREARRFAYADVAAAFRRYRDFDSHGRPFVLVGVEQGGGLAARLLREEIMPDPAMRSRLAIAYLIDAATPADAPPAPPCLQPTQTGCVAAWVGVVDGDLDRGRALLDRALVWTAGGQLDGLGDRLPLCFNPLLGAVTEEPAAPRLNLGAANATGLEWAARPAFLTRQVGARCENGVLKISRPASSSLRPSGSWTDRRKVPGYNLFYANLEADAKARLAALAARPPATVAGLNLRP
jgi:hypothetical protein